jgi:hypothetical protein
MNRPSDPLDQLSGVMTTPQIRGRDPLVKGDRALRLGVRLAHHDDSRHINFLAVAGPLGTTGGPIKASMAMLASHAPTAEALTSGFQRALLASSIFLLAAAFVALRVANTRGEEQQPGAETPRDGRQPEDDPVEAVPEATAA